MPTARVADEKRRRKIDFLLVEHLDDVGGHLGRRTEAGEQQEEDGFLHGAGENPRKHIKLTEILLLFTLLLHKIK